jgi:hypothetical protein
MKCYHTGRSGAVPGIPLTWQDSCQRWGVDLGGTFLKMSLSSTPEWTGSQQGGWFLVDGFFRRKSKDFKKDSKTPRPGQEKFLVLVPTGRLPKRVFEWVRSQRVLLRGNRFSIVEAKRLP